jgi:hypothetical protein
VCLAREGETAGEREPKPWDVVAHRFIAEHPDLAAAIAKADAASESIGVSAHDYVTLYRAIHKLQAQPTRSPPP